MNQENIFDVAIVGYGPAGITAAIYAARRNLKVILIGHHPGGEVINSGKIENWPGGGETDGFTLAQSMINHLKLHEDKITILQKEITKIAKSNDHFILSTDNEKYLSRTVIYAAGRRPKKLKVPGEEEFKNLGVSYCATCDAPLFTNQAVAVIGGGNSGAEAVIILKNIARKIYLLQHGDKLTADPVLIENFVDDPKVEVIFHAAVTRITGEKMVSTLTYLDQSRQQKELSIQGVFVTIGSIPNIHPVKDLVALNKYDAIIANRYGQTNIDGFFAAGDVTDIRDAQIVVAAGHGCSAALSAGDYLSRSM